MRYSIPQIVACAVKCLFQRQVRLCLQPIAGLVLMASIGWSEDPPASPDSTSIKQLKEVYRNDAAEFSIFRDAELREKLELREEPVYIWTNVLKGQSGSVFVWTWHGRPEAIGSIFSDPVANGRRGFVHELHTLSTSTLVPQRASPHKWTPRAGVKRTAIQDAPKPADTPRQRLIQMRDLTKDFTAQSKTVKQESWELRLLTQPLYRYQSTDAEVIDGALFSFVTSAGTDPEVLLILEAIKTDADPTWAYALCRFSDSNLYVSHQGTEVWSSVRDADNPFEHDALHLYRAYVDRIVKDAFAEPKP